MRNFVVYALLISFFMLWSPRSLWHECHTSHEHNLSKDEVLITKDSKCFTCDFDCDTADPFISLNIKIRKGEVQVGPDKDIPSFYAPSLNTTNLRGPPQYS